MRYFKDGDLECGLEPSKEAYDFDLHALDADYYIAWIYRRAELLNHLRHAEDDDHYRTKDPERYMNEQILCESNFPDISRETVIQLQQPENTRKTKQTEKGGKPIWINVHFKHFFELQYLGNYTDRVLSTYKLEESHSDGFEFSDTCEMYFGTVRDDNGHPFLRLRFEYGTSSKKTGDLTPMGPIEMVAKRIHDDGPGELGKRDFSKNEKLRLGFSMDSEGNFVSDLRLSKEGMTPTETADDLATLQGVQKKLEANVLERVALFGQADKIMEGWKERFDAIATSLPRSPVSRKAAPQIDGDATSNSNNNGKRHSNLNTRPSNHSKGYANGHVNGRAISSSNESEVSLPPSRDVSLPTPPPRISRQRNLPNPTNPDDELAAPESSQRASKRARLSKGKGHS